MERRKDIESARRTTKLPRLVLPPYKPPTHQELERRQLLGEKADEVREKIGPLGFSLSDLIREDRESR